MSNVQNPNPNRVLAKMLERLFASLVNGPSLNCRPHNSRQRIDLLQLGKLQDIDPGQGIQALLGEPGAVRFTPKVPTPRKLGPETNQPPLTPEEKATRTAWADQEGVFRKLRSFVEDGKIYEQDTGVHVLNLGFPLLSLPSGSFGAKSGFTRRIIAPIAFIPVNVTVKQGAVRAIELSCRGDGADLVSPNVALFAWLEQQTGSPQPELFVDEKGEDPGREIRDLIAYAAKLVELPLPAFAGFLTSASGTGVASWQGFELRCVPRSDEDDGKAILPAAVLGLFPAANQGLLRDMQALVAGEPVSGPLESFIALNDLLGDAGPSAPANDQTEQLPKRVRSFAAERLITAADPCQSRAVRLAREAKGLVIHGPPGTGKSQTLTNIIGDHLARGQRVLVVCDKRGALDVVLNRLESMGVGKLCAVVHDPQRDQRDLYKAIRQQLEELPDVRTNPQAQNQLAKLDAELQRLHGELTDYSTALNKTDPADGRSFHDLVGAWLAIAPDRDLTLPDGALAGTGIDLFDRHTQDLQDVLERAAKIQWPASPWRKAAGSALEDFLARPMEQVRTPMGRCTELAVSADAAADPAICPFSSNHPVEKQAQEREQLAQALAPWCDQHGV